MALGKHAAYFVLARAVAAGGDYVGVCVVEQLYDLSHGGGETVNINGVLKPVVGVLYEYRVFAARPVGVDVGDC